MQEFGGMPPPLSLISTVTQPGSDPLLSGSLRDTQDAAAVGHGLEGV